MAPSKIKLQLFEEDHLKLVSLLPTDDRPVDLHKSMCNQPDGKISLFIISIALEQGSNVNKAWKISAERKWKEIWMKAAENGWRKAMACDQQGREYAIDTIPVLVRLLGSVGVSEKDWRLMRMREMDDTWDRGLRTDSYCQKGMKASARKGDSLGAKLGEMLSETFLTVRSSIL